ncbi:hypothetical protein NDU88_001498 [Pleurodeles waltl]|uniref:Uncharacterized protein n=1 Tax=Pleurodeles waltl TaxID=8319 RepID=A0AAV7T0I5_PLEWA|nr:hypothetical protein NDU88_001498 [Pleurodeles waltl]
MKTQLKSICLRMCTLPSDPVNMVLKRLEVTVNPEKGEQAGECGRLGEVGAAGGGGAWPQPVRIYTGCISARGPGVGLREGRSRDVSMAARALGPRVDAGVTRGQCHATARAARHCQCANTDARSRQVDRASH